MSSWDVRRPVFYLNLHLNFRDVNIAVLNVGPPIAAEDSETVEATHLATVRRQFCRNGTPGHLRKHFLKTYCLDPIW